MKQASQLRRDIMLFLEAMVDTVESGYRVYKRTRRQAIIGYHEPMYSRREVRRMVTRLAYQGHLKVDHDYIELTPEGHTQALRYRLEQLRLEKPTEWDGRWRLVIWDIPERSRGKRDVVRLTLKKLGFVRIQRSIWVTPYPCRDAIEILRTQLDITAGLLYVEATVIEGAAKLRRYFHVVSPDNSGENE